ncbi:MAG: type III-B CRISPR module RAMP protein Cmr4 [Anaerolineaceae bacterium]|jgi:CRISPR-associated protein Cmr4|nr:MAG: type III-B CRISPR module RAMP protein Cmr4 [Anaerolineaceae bacterium]
MTTDRYLHQRYLLMTLDPVHPGAGGYRLGRVDNSIAREPGTRLPKIPGSSLHGAARSYAAYLYGTPDAAGQNHEKVKDPETNPILYTFGQIIGDKMYSGVVNLFDAQLLFFPVHSMVGPVWVSTPQRLRDAGFKNIPDGSPQDAACWTSFNHNERLNLGWLLLDVVPDSKIEITHSMWGDAPQWATVANRLVLVSDTLFSHLVNSNLEVRTSVAIDPQTGAADDGALYTYEAIPRATFLTAEVVLDDYYADKDNRPFPTETTQQGDPLPGKKWQGPLDVVAAGLSMMEYLSVGGMGTRGFGRIKVVGKPTLKSQDDIFKSLEEPK